MNLGWWLESATWDSGDKIAMINGDETECTFSKLNSLANKMANVLKNQFDVSEDDVVCTLIKDDHWHVALCFAILKAGAVYCALNRTQVLDKFKYDVGVTKPKLLIVDKQFLGVAKALLEETNNVKAVAVCDDIESGYLNIKNLIEDASDQFRVVPRSNDDLAIINFTAGSTGPSKGVMCTHMQYLTSILSTIFHYGLKSSDKNIMIGYLFHNSGTHSAICCVVARVTNIWLGGWNAEKCMAFVEKYKPTWFHLMAPVMVRDMMSRPKFKEVDFSGIKMYLAGEPVSADIQESLKRKGVRTLGAYGMTETMPLGVCVPSMYYGEESVVPQGSVGKADNKDFGVAKLIDVITKEEIKEPFVKGEVYFKGDVLTSGYYKDPQRTREAIDDEGWFHTSDLAYMDEGGYYYVGGRTDDIISSGAEKLSLSELETVLLRHPKVQDAACIGVDHDRYGQVAAAFIKPTEEIDEEMLLKELDEYMVANLEKWKRPRLYIKTEEIPRITAKRSKDLGTLHKLVNGITLKDEYGIVNMSGLQKLTSQK